MGAYKFSLKMLKVNFKQSLLYLFAVIFPIAIIVNLINMINNQTFFVNGGGNNANDAAVVVFFLAILVCIFSFYANSYFIKSKSKEMAIEELNGMTSGILARTLLFQNAVVEITGGTIGIILGILFMPLFLKLMYSVMALKGSIWMLSPTAVWGTIAILFLQIGYVSMGDYSYTSTREIIDLMNINKKVRSKDARYLKFDSRIYIILYLPPILSIPLCKKPTDVATMGIFNVVFTIFGLRGILNFYIPEKLLKLKKEKYLEDKIKLIALSNVHESIKKVKFIIATLIITTEVILCIASAFGDKPQIKIVCVISYVTSMIMIASSFVYKTILDIDIRRHTFSKLRIIGYTNKQLKTIVNEEFKIFYTITVVISLVPILIFVYLFAKNNIISMEISIFMLGIFFIVFFIAAIVSYVMYRKLIFQKRAYRIL